jgi:hypothetical protein
VVGFDGFWISSFGFPRLIQLAHSPYSLQFIKFQVNDNNFETLIENVGPGESAWFHSLLMLWRSALDKGSCF